MNNKFPAHNFFFLPTHITLALALKLILLFNDNFIYLPLCK